jgi:hypothetical protein
MKSTHALSYILTLVLTGEWAAEFFANNINVLVLLVAALLMWYYLLKSPPKGGAPKIQPPS